MEKGGLIFLMILVSNMLCLLNQQFDKLRTYIKSCSYVYVYMWGSDKQHFQNIDVDISNIHGINKSRK